MNFHTLYHFNLNNHIVKLYINNKLVEIGNSKKVEKACRINRSPIFLHMRTVRLMGHAGSDIEIDIEH